MAAMTTSFIYGTSTYRIKQSRSIRLSVVRKLVVITCFLSTMSMHAQNISTRKIEEQLANTFSRGLSYQKNEVFDSAISCYSDCLQLIKLENAQNSFIHVLTLTELGFIYHLKGDSVNKTIICDSILQIGKNIRPNTLQYAKYLFLVSKYFVKLDDFNLAEKYFDMAESLSNHLNNSELNAEILDERSYSLFLNQDYVGALETQKKCIKASEKSNYLKALLYYQYLNRAWQEVDSLLPICFEQERESILREFNQKSSKERNQIWTRSHSFFVDFLPTLVINHASPIISSYTYNSLLFSKSLLLAADIKTCEMVLSSNNQELISSYRRMLRLKGDPSKTVNDEFEILAISDAISTFLKSQKKQFRKDFRTTWEDVQSALPPRGAAIEFFTFSSGENLMEYAALIITKDSPFPQLIRLSTQQTYESIHRDSIYTNNMFYDLVWGRLLDILTNVDQVFFSPAGLFHNTGIEYLPNKEGFNFCSMFDVYRLTSTREIVIKKQRKINNGLIIGGVDYDNHDDDSTFSRLPAADSLDQSLEMSRFSKMIERNTNMGNGGFSYLPGTKVEVEAISKILTDAGFSHELCMGDKASEAKLKSMSGNEIGLIHIATHGFCESKQIINTNYFSTDWFKIERCGLDSIPQRNDPHNTLHNSGIILSGANKVLSSTEINYNGLDGIMFSDELSTMDFSSTDIVVVSACQSGLGDISVSEGVFGLQRGLKLSGVNSIMMSLWKVDDNATSILMTLFYRNLFDGQPKRLALTNAQLELRTIYGGFYDSPQYWAAFVLLDAID